MKRIALWSAIAFLGVFLVFPLGHVVWQSFIVEGRFSLEIFRSLVGNPVLRESVVNSVFLGLLVVAFAGCIGVPLAFLFFRYRFRGKGILRLLFFLPMIMSPFVGGIGMRQILARFGSLNLLLMKVGLMRDPVSWLGSGFWGIVILETLHLYPIMFLNMTASLNHFDAACEEASQNLGASAWDTFRRVTFPLLMPGFFAAASIIFIWSVTDLGTPLVFDYPNLVSVQIFNNLTDIHANPSGYALVVVVVLLTLLLFSITKGYLERTPYAAQRTVSTIAERPLKGVAAAVALSAMGFLLAVSLAPHASVLLTSLSKRWFISVLPQEYSLRFYRLVATHPLTRTGIANSLVYSGLSTVLDVTLGLTIGFLLARTRYRGRFLLDLLAMAPLAVPGVVLAFGYVTAFSGTVLDPAHNPVFLIVVGYSVRRLPYLVRSTCSSFQQIGQHYEEASYNLGAGTAGTFRRILLPLLGPGLFAGGILVFTFSMLEVSSGLILALREQHFPVAKVIYMLAGRVTDGPYMACALGVLGMVLVGMGLVLATRLASRKIGEFFRIG